MKRKHLRHYSQ